MNFGEYTKFATVTLCGLFLFFLGFSLLFQREALANALTLLVAIIITIALSYWNRSPAGGLVIGFFASLSVVFGFFVTVCIWELSAAIVANRAWTLGFLSNVISIYGLGLFSAVLALSSIGLFFGILGYVFGHISLDVTVSQPLVYRDYWSNVLRMGKNDKREYSELDRKLSGWSVRKRDFWKHLVERLTQPQSDIAFVPRPQKDPAESSKGDVFDVSSGHMIGENFLDPSDLISKYRPLVVKVAEVSSTPRGVRRLKIETIIARFLARFIPSRAIWVPYLLLSALLTFSTYWVWTNNFGFYPYYEGADVVVVTSALISSVMILFFVWRWRKASRVLFERRPDERILVFVVYVMLGLLFGFCYWVIVRPPGDLVDWPMGWLVWTVWFLFLSLVLGVGYALVHRECEVVNTYFYDNNSPKLKEVKMATFKDAQDEPFWLKEDKTKAFWVLRFMYFWKYEFAKVPHPDWERVEVWIDAEKGTPKWVVSDYHYRELWYKVKGNLDLLYVRFLINFHTPIPVTDSEEADSLTKTINLETKKVLRGLFSNKYMEIFASSSPLMDRLDWSKIHSSSWVQKYGLPGFAANFCSSLNWSYWRYPFGIEKPEEYLKKPAATREDEPSESLEISDMNIPSRILKEK